MNILMVIPLVVIDFGPIRRNNDGQSLKCGIYAVINKKLNAVYIGQTQICFLIRWIEHLSRIEMYSDDFLRLKLYLDEHTQFLVLKILDIENGTP